MKLSCRPALVTVHAVHQPVCLLLGAAYPLANTVKILFMDRGLQLRRLRQAELMVQEPYAGTLIKGMGVAGKAELGLGLIVLLVPQLTIGLVQGFEDVRRYLVPFLMT